MTTRKSNSNVFKAAQWWMKKYDGRKSEFRGISREEFRAASDKHFDRIGAADCGQSLHEWRVEYLRYFATVPYAYEGDGLDDYSKFQRPCRNGKGYVALCPGEPRNNVYVDDPVLVGVLTSKYNRIKGK